MENNIDLSNHLSGGFLPFQVIEERFDDWVRWLQLITHGQENPSMTRPAEHRGEPGNESIDDEYNDTLQLNDEWYWLDDGGESGEVV